MDSTKIIIALTIHLLIPLLGLLIYIQLIKRIKKSNIINPPIIDLFLIFAIYGGLLIIMLTSLFWVWSGLASIGTIFLIIIAPIVMLTIIIRNYNQRTISVYHRGTFISAVLFFLITPIAIGLIFWMEN